MEMASDISYSMFEYAYIFPLSLLDGVMYWPRVVPKLLQKFSRQTFIGLTSSKMYTCLCKGVTSVNVLGFF